MADLFVNLPACLIGTEARGSAHHWARKLQGFGYTVKLMHPSSSNAMSRPTKTLLLMLKL
jgi:transposase